MLNTFRIVVALVPIASTLPPVLSSSLLTGYEMVGAAVRLRCSRSWRMV